ncbi:MAG: cytochrome c biogenesis protein CcsA [Sedimentisphaerales bacterium]|nr:cytochrome c biogenesis protein CcsA [Sedimentisphaerales bacterium]
MEIKYTIQGLLIYAAIAAYLSAFLTTFLRRQRVGNFLYLLGFIAAVLAFIYRWYDVRHVPLQNLFEVFLCLGMISYPVSWFCRYTLRAGGYSGDLVIAAIMLVPAGFVFSAEPQRLPPALQSWLFVPHVAVYALSYIFMAKAAFQAIFQLLAPALRRGYPGQWPGLKADEKFLSAEEATYRMICVGFPLLTLGLILGSCWGKLAWGDYWGWDPKELWSLASWLVYVGYFHFRYMFGKKYARINSLWAIAGMVFILITLFWVNLSNLFSGLHSYAR